MKIKIITLVFLLTFSFSSLFTERANALSCVPIIPIIGTVSKVSPQESYVEIALADFYTFQIDNLMADKTYNIDQYEKIIQEYSSNDFKQFTKPDSDHLERAGWMTMTYESYKKANIIIGDIVINGPPSHVCSYGFTGQFTTDGKIKNAIIYDNFNDYSYHDNKIEVTSGKELTCESDKCKMSVNFNLNNSSFNLNPGESKKLTNNSISSVTLLDSSNMKKSKDGSTPFDWGFNTYASYILNFSGSNTETGTSTNSLMSTTSVMTDTTPSPIPTNENLNFFQKIWKFCLSFFE